MARQEIESWDDTVFYEQVVVSLLRCIRRFVVNDDDLLLGEALLSISS